MSGRRLAGDLTSEIDDVTVWAVALLRGRGTVRDRAAVRRQMLAAACKRARRDPAVAQLVAAVMEHRAANPPAPPEPPANVYPLRRRS